MNKIIQNTLFYIVVFCVTYFIYIYPIEILNELLFSEKAKLFPNSVFIIGADTLVRIMDEKFYSSRKDMLDQIERFNDHNINFLVFGRKVKDSFITLDQIDIPTSLKNRFTGIDETGFRQDISSRSLRLEKI